MWELTKVSGVVVSFFRHRTAIRLGEVSGVF